MKGLPPSLSALKAEAKTLKKATSGKHSDCLEKVARSYGFAHFHEAVKFYGRNVEGTAK